MCYVTFTRLNADKWQYEQNCGDEVET